MLVDSVRLCPCCGKRMSSDVGQDLEPDDYGLPVLRQVESCLSCGHAQSAPPDHPFDWYTRVQVVLAHNFEVSDHSGCGEGEPCRATRPGMVWAE